MTRPMTQRYLLVIVPFLLLWGRLTNGNLVHDHHNKRLRLQDQPNEKDSTRTNPMSLQFLIHPSDDQEPRSKLYHSPEQNPELVYPQRHSGKRKQLGCDISPDSDQVTAHSAQFDSIHSSEPNYCLDDEPESSSVPGSQVQIGHHHSHAKHAFLDSETLARCNKMKGQWNHLCLQMYYFLVQQYSLTRRGIPQKKSRGKSVRELLDEYNRNGNFKIKEEVERIMKGPVQEGLGGKIPTIILRLNLMREILYGAEAKCERQKGNPAIAFGRGKNLDENINYILKHITENRKSLLSLQTFISTSGSQYLKETISYKLGSNTIIGIAFKRNATDSFQVHFIWLPQNENYTCKVLTDHFTRHYYFMSPFLLYVHKSVEHTLVAFLLRFYDYMKSGGEENLASYHGLHHEISTV
ncbi:hypothetical protein IWQ62_002529 [Dispira parvispora]|uniref:Uncharacterized protein n=1 Tax=Dispira parvispora TaxID=1520584 RepID=A0A9W8AVW2_9FUNG|nr:hypothetical protein IWQ62_002529 [Dispira parvispora]